jgi:DNA-binding response OmpR family regulator
MEGIVRCIELGAEDYLPKSFDPPLLRARLGAVLEKKRLRDLADQRLALLEAEAGERARRAARPRAARLRGDRAGRSLAARRDDPCSAGGRRPLRRGAARP